MKKTTTTKYETSDGRTFDQPLPAQEHEIALLAESLRPDDAKRLTASALIRQMASHPDKFGSLLLQFERPETEEEQPERAPDPVPRYTYEEPMSEHPDGEPMEAAE